MTFGQFITLLRRQAGYTQQNIAELLGIDRSTYTYYENDKTLPNIQYTRQLANLYNLTVDELIDCRIHPRAVDTMRAPEPELPNLAVENLQFFRSLTNEEKSLVLLYRSCGDRDALMRAVRSFCSDLSDRNPTEDSSPDGSV